MADLSRRAASAARRFVARTSERWFTDGPKGTWLRAQVTTVTAAGAADGIAALVTVTCRGEVLTVNDYPDSYTPVATHPVLCVLVDGQLSIIHHAIGQP